MKPQQGTQRIFGNILGMDHGLIKSLEKSLPEKTGTIPAQIHKTVHSDKVVLEIRRLAWLNDWLPSKITKHLNEKGVIISLVQVQAFRNGVNRLHLQPCSSIQSYLE